MYIRVYPFATSLALCLNSLLIYSPTIRGGSDTSSIYFSSGKDVASLNRSDVSASAETRHQKCTQMYTFDDAQQRSRCPPLASAVEKTIRKPFENSGAGYKALNKQHPQAYLLYVEDCCLFSNAVDGVHIFKSLRSPYKVDNTYPFWQQGFRACRVR